MLLSISLILILGMFMGWICQKIKLPSLLGCGCARHAARNTSGSSCRLVHVATVASHASGLDNPCLLYTSTEDSHEYTHHRVRGFKFPMGTTVITPSSFTFRLLKSNSNSQAVSYTHLNDNDTYTRYYNFGLNGYVDFPFGLQLRTDRKSTRLNSSHVK